jgi:class 3 adenylate cyclase
VKEYDKALEYSFKSLQLAKRDSVQGKFRFPGKYMNISLTYLNMGVEYIDSADLYMEQAIFWAEKTHNYYLIQGYYRQWANFHRHYGNMERFHELIEMAYNSRTSAIKKENMSLLLSDVGVSYYYLNKTSIGIKFCLRAKQIADSTGMNFPMKIANFNLYEIYNDMKLFDKALIHYKNFVYLTDSIKKEENQRAVIRNTFKHEYEKKALADSLEFAKAEELKDLEIEKQSAELSQQRIGLAATGVGLILIIALAASIHKGKKRSDELLLNILPEETAQELKAKGSAESKLIEDTTVLFTDFEGFTAMSENVTASALVKDINECFSAFDHIMEKHGVEKIKTIGDAYMAAGGLPTPNKTHVKDVVLAALEIADFMKDWAAKKEAKGKPHFDIRIGVNTGPVVAGIVGVKKFQYDIWGDTVNTASRMESASDVGKVNISESTYNKLKDEPQFAFDYRGEIEAKGKGKVKMWFVNRKNT